MFAAQSQDVFHSDPHWTELIGPVIGVLALLMVLLWLIGYLRRAMSQGKQCLDQSRTAVDLTREAIEAQKEGMALQRETNALLVELIAIIRQRTPE